MYEKDKERYEKEMKKYTSDKVPKEPPTKKPRTKTQKQKTTASSSSTKGTPAIIKESSPDQRSSLVSPTLNPLSPQSLASMQLSIPHIPMPQLLSLAEEESEFDNYEELHSAPQDSFLWRVIDNIKTYVIPEIAKAYFALPLRSDEHCLLSYNVIINLFVRHLMRVKYNHQLMDIACKSYCLSGSLVKRCSIQFSKLTLQEMYGNQQRA